MTEIVSWGVLYYAFPVLASGISAHTGWSEPAVTAAFSAGLVTSALVGIRVGRWVDRHGPRGVMATGSVVAVAALLAMAAAPSLGWFAAAWVAIGVAMGAVLYPPAFAALIGWYGSQSVAALTTLTLVAGLASTLFAPVTAALASHFSWRTTYLALAILLAAVTIPGHMFGLRRSWPVVTTPHPIESPTRTARTPQFVALTTAFALAASTSYAVVINLVPMMTERAISTGVAAVALGLGGVGQVVGRLGYRTLASRIPVVPRTVVVFTCVAGTTALLGVFTTPLSLIIVAALAGAARGIMTLLQATAVSERWGDAHYGHLSGILSAPVTLATAAGPWIGAALARLLHGYGPMFVLLGGLGLLGAVISAATGAHPPATTSTSHLPKARPRRSTSRENRCAT